MLMWRREVKRERRAWLSCCHASNKLGTGAYAVVDPDIK